MDTVVLTTEDQDRLIRENMTIAKRIGQKYASANGRLPDESVAEAYYWLVIFFREDNRLWLASVRPEWTMGVYIKRALIKYFERENKRFEQISDDRKEVVIRNTDEEMIEFLSGLNGDENAWKIFDLLRGGVDLFSAEIIDPAFRKVLKKMRLQVQSRVARIKALQRLGLTTSRDVYTIPEPLDAGDEAPELLGVQAV